MNTQSGFSKTSSRTFKLLRAIFGFLLILAAASATLYGQYTQNTTDKADQRLKSNARINPSTLAMEFSLPLAVYPGRSGNSFPLALSYSSKVWSMRRTNYQSDTQQIVGSGYNSLTYQSTDVTADFSLDRRAGWSSNLGPVTILTLDDVYNQWGNSLFSLWMGGGNNSTYTEGCRLGQEEFRPASDCLSGIERWRVWYCPSGTSPDGSHVEERECTWSTPSGGGGWQTPIGSGAEPQVPHFVDSLRVEFQDGSKKEFRRSDGILNQYPITGAPSTYLSVDGSRMRLEVNEDQGNQQSRTVLYLPDGSRYLFPVLNASSGETVADRFIDADGNVTSYSETTRRWTDSMGREIADPFLVGLVKGINGADVPYVITGEPLADALENPEHTQLKYLGEDDCRSPITNATPIAPALFRNQPAHPLDDQIENTTRYIRKHRACASLWTNGPIGLFNPTVVSAITLPDGSKYRFRYNEYAEITRIEHPTGGYERFEYDFVQPIGYTALEVYTQSNRGVVAHFLSYDGATESETRLYEDSGSGTAIINPDGTRTERDLYYTDRSSFGTDDPRNGMVREERVKDANGALRSRTLTEWVVTPPSGTGMIVPNGRDPRPTRTISIRFEGGAILASMTETVYDDPGPNSSAPADPSFFARLNPRQTKSYHFLTLDNDEATAAYEAAIVDLAAKFHAQGQLASVTETEYLYDANYKAAGIPSLVAETRVLNPIDPSQAIAKTQTLYDDLEFAPSGALSGPQAATWIDPSTGSKIQACLSQLGKQCRGKPTSVRLWDSDREAWITSRTQYDQYGNPRKAWEPDEPTTSDRFVETEYSADYYFAYPTRIVTPAPDPTGVHGTQQKSEALSVYDLTTGLVLSTTALNDLATSSGRSDDGDRLRHPSAAGPFLSGQFQRAGSTHGIRRAGLERATGGQSAFCARQETDRRDELGCGNDLVRWFGPDG
ncbi:MAG: hypothetical protein IPK58_07520 [Acidobacteria bacterium]|nr:hypothetical protein [Acidobacteriota bacterium]